MPVFSGGLETKTCGPEAQTGWISAAAVASKCSIPERIAQGRGIEVEVIVQPLAIGRAATGRAVRIVELVTRVQANRLAPVTGVQASRRARAIGAQPNRQAQVLGVQARVGATALSRCNRAGPQISSPHEVGQVTQALESRAVRFPPVPDFAAEVAEAEGFEVVVVEVDGVPISR